MEKTGLVYKATNKINGKIYIGQTINSLAKRKSQHKSKLYENNNLFAESIRKHGWDNFEWETLQDKIPIEDLDLVEKQFIKQYNSTKEGYNSPPGYKNHNDRKYIFPPKQKVIPDNYISEEMLDIIQSVIGPIDSSPYMIYHYVVIKARPGSKL